MNRNELIQHTRNWIARLGSQTEVAKKIGINVGTLSTWLRGIYGADTEKMDARIAAALEYRPKNWVTVPGIANYRHIEMIVSDAKDNHLWSAISNKAGSGKTETLEDIYNRDRTGSVLFIQAEEWTAHQFLDRLAVKLAGPPKNGRYRNISELTDIVVSYICELDAPALLIDEADKLRPSALRSLIPIYNRTRGHLGCILAGTENLEKEIKTGVRCNKKGYDELDSRLGRTYLRLQGASEKDVCAICEANGVTDAAAKAEIWNQLEKTVKVVKVRSREGGTAEKKVAFAEDFRRIERVIRKEIMLNGLNHE
jgi:type II secretory pathway predicted ATPase ExeA